MEDYFSKLGVEEFTNKVADKVIERGANRIAEHVVEKLKPILSKSSSSLQSTPEDTLLTRKEAAKKLKVSEPTLRKMYTEGTLKAYGIGTRRIRLKSSEVIAALDNL
ncbi:MAG: helix-turn-helix transcriptional regulator [Saprospiraceae bacterium]